MISGFLADYWGWPSIFYTNGVVGVIWTVAYIFLGAATPSTSKMISPQERMYIESSLGHVGGANKVVEILHNEHICNVKITDTINREIHSYSTNVYAL